MYELLVNCIPADLVIKRLLIALLPRLDETSKHEAVKAAAMFEHRLQEGSKAIFHLEAFVAKIMFLLKQSKLEV